MIDVGGTFSASAPSSLGLIFWLVSVNLSSWAFAWTMFHRQPALLATALLAWVFGIRHAVDVDHIAAIDNVVRKLMQDGRRPFTAGLWFSLGHSTVVVLLCIAVATSAGALGGSQVIAKEIGGDAGTLISASFLLGIGLVNLVMLRGIWQAYKQARNVRTVSGGANRVPAIGGLLQRITAPLCHVITRSWHMYPLGLLFGLGFDTATEIGLLSISATQFAHGLSPWKTMMFPALFTAGMTLVDTADSIVMVRTYGSAFINPLRKLLYNFTVTMASISVALLIGGVEVLDLLRDKMAFQGSFWETAHAINSRAGLLGVVVIGLFILCWFTSALASRRLRASPP